MYSFAQAHDDHLDPDNYEAKYEAIVNAGPSINVHNFEDLCKARELGETTFDDVRSNTYKYTECGASFDLIDGGVRLGTIVEGVDDYSIDRELIFPFTMDDFWGTLDSICQEASDCWDDTHGCEDCNVGEGELGYPCINKDCQTCEGAGTII